MMGTERKKWTLADLFLILLAILSLLGILFRIVGMRKVGGDGFSDYAVEMMWENVDLRTAASVVVGEVLYASSGEIFGRVISVESRPFLVELRQNGKIHRVESIERCDMLVRVVVRAREADGQILSLGGDALMIGQTKCLYSMTAELPLLITSIGEKMPV